MAGPNVQGDAQPSEKQPTNQIKDVDYSQYLSQQAFEPKNQKDANAAPDGVERYTTWAAEGAKNFIPGVGKAIVEDVKHPWETVKMLGLSAGIGGLMKAALPERSPSGMITSLAIGAYFMYENSEPFMKSLHDAENAQTKDELKGAGVELGDAAGSFALNSAASIYAARWGARGANALMATESMDGIAEAKAKFWNSMDNKLAAASKPLGLGVAGSLDMQPRFRIEDGKAFLADSEKAAPKGDVKGAVDPNAQVRLSIYLKGQDFKLDRRIARIDAGKADFVTDEEFKTKFAPKPEAVQKLNDYAAKHGLTVENYDPRYGRAEVTGTAKQMQTAFMDGRDLQQVVRNDGVTHRGREGQLVLNDPSLAPHIDGILGLDNRPALKARNSGFQPFEEKPQAHSIVAPVEGVEPEAAASNGLRPKPVLASDLAKARGFTDQYQGSGLNIGIGELGGDLNIADDAKLYTSRGMQQPNIRKIALNGVEIKSDGPQGADGEVALDSNNIGLAANKAGQSIVWGNNDDTGIADVTNRMTFPEAGEPENVAQSWSWGQFESGWTDQALRVTENAFKKAYAKGIAVFAAAGDDGASDRAPGKKFATDYPASSRYVTGVGGTQVVIDANGVAHDRAWNDGAMGGSTGGGISDVIPRPDFQKDVKLPPNGNGSKFDGRGVPDVAEDASPRSGYVVRVGGREGAIGGTSGAAPMWAAYTARWSEALGRKIGNINNFIYKHGTDGIFTDVTEGDNNGYKSGPGYDVVTGWGVPKAQEFLNALKKDFADTKKVRAMFPAPVQVDAQPNDKSNAS